MKTNKILRMLILKVKELDERTEETEVDMDTLFERTAEEPCDCEACLLVRLNPMFFLHVEEGRC